MTVQYAKLRVQFGRPIGSFQAVKHKCATMRMWPQGSKAATYYAAMAVAADADDAEEAAGVAKAYTSSAIAALTSEALQVHGGIGFTWELDLHLYHRRANGTRSCSVIPICTTSGSRRRWKRLPPRQPFAGRTAGPASPHCRVPRFEPPRCRRTCRSHAQRLRRHAVR
jgi:hypothetical protein